MKGPELFDPSIHQVERGMMISMMHRNQKTYIRGSVIDDVDIDKQMILVRASIGGTKEMTSWIPLALHRVTVWWLLHEDGSRMTYDEVIQLHHDFGAALKRQIKMNKEG